MAEKIKVLLTEPIRPAGMAYLTKEAEVVIAPDPSAASAAALAYDCQAIISRNTKVDKQIFSRSPKLKVVASHGVGTDHIDVQEATQRGICVVNTPGANAESVAELTAGFMLMLSRKIRDADLALRLERDYYSRNQWIGKDLYGKSVFIVGMGAIGRKLARICKLGFGMEAFGYDPFLNKDQMAQTGVIKAETLEEGLALADFVSLNCPYTDDMYHMIDSRRLALMKKTACLINCARGPLVDERALIAALRDGAIAGAAVDVFEKEPPNRDNPLFDCPNLIATPHIGANAEDSIDNMSLYSSMDVIAVVRKEYDKARIVNPQAISIE